MSFAEVVQIILLLICAVLIFIGLTGRGKISFGSKVSVDAGTEIGDLSSGSRFLLAAGGVIGIVLVLTLFPSSLPTYQLGRSAQAIPRSVPANPTSPSASASSANPTVASPVTVVEEYFSAINNHDYAKAWAIGGKNSGAASKTDFINGFNGTAYDGVTILSLSGNVVTARLVARQTDGSVKVFRGHYTVENGAITNFNVWRSG